MTINDDIRERIGRLEREGETLAETIESCRKAMTLSQIAMCLGGVAFIVDLFGLLRLPAAMVLVSIAAVIGGIVFFGSNHSTRLEAENRARAIDSERAQCIDKLELFDSGATLH